MLVGHHAENPLQLKSNCIVNQLKGTMRKTYQESPKRHGLSINIHNPRYSIYMDTVNLL